MITFDKKAKDFILECFKLHVEYGFIYNEDGFKITDKFNDPISYDNFAGVYKKETGEIGYISNNICNLIDLIC